MTLTPLTPLRAHSVPHIAHAAAKAKYLRDPGMKCYNSSGATSVGGDMFHLDIDVDPIIEDAWTATLDMVSVSNKVFKRDWHDYSILQ